MLRNVVSTDFVLLIKLLQFLHFFSICICKELQADIYVTAIDWLRKVNITISDKNTNIDYNLDFLNFSVKVITKYTSML